MEVTSRVNTWIVEDNALFRGELISLIASSEDIYCSQDFCEVEQLEAFIESVEASNLPDVILMDINLPGKNGIEGTHAIKAYYPELSIVILTLHEKAEMIYDALRAGANGYLLKSMAFEETLTAIRLAARGGMMIPPAVAQKVWMYFNELSHNDSYNLTPRELEVLKKMCDGLTQKEIGNALFISENTVGQHVKMIYQKLHVHTRTGAVAKALRERLVK